MQSDEPYGLYNKTKHDIRDTADKLYQLLADISYSKRAQLISPVRCTATSRVTRWACSTNCKSHRSGSQGDEAGIEACKVQQAHH